MAIRGQLPCSLEGRLAGVPGWATACALILGSLSGCGSAPPSEHEIAYARSMRPTTELATTEAEEQALERAAVLPSGERTQIEGQSVLAMPIYTAASGRRCRELQIGDRSRLACEAVDAESWVFVPDVFARPISTSGGVTVPTDDGPSSTEEPDAPEEGSS